jgi:hypothetical protein
MLVITKGYCVSYNLGKLGKEFKHPDGIKRRYKAAAR